jgi:hypothetical protein
LAQLNKYIADLIIDETGAALATAPASVAEARLVLAARFAPIKANMNDYLQGYQSFQAAKEIKFKNAVDQVVAYRQTGDALPSLVGTYTPGTASPAVAAKLVVQGDLSAYPYSHAVSTALGTFKFGGASDVTNDTELTVSGGISTFTAGSTGVVAGAPTVSGPMELSFAASSASAAVVTGTAKTFADSTPADLTGTYTAGAAAVKGKLVMATGVNLSLAPYNIATGTALTTFKFGSASGVSAGVQLTITGTSSSDWVSTFEAAANGAIAGTSAGSMDLTFVETSGSKAVVGGTALVHSNGWLLESAIKFPELATAQAPDTYFLADKTDATSILQPAFTYTDALGTYISTETPEAGQFRGKTIKINGPLATANADFLLQLNSAIPSDTFNHATTTLEEVEAVRGGFVKTPTVTEVIAAGASIVNNVIAGLNGFSVHAKKIGFTAANYGTWDEPMLVAQNPNNDVYIYSASQQYRAKTQLHDNTQLTAAMVLAAEKTLGSDGPNTVENAVAYVGTGTVVVERADGLLGWVSDSTIKASELYMRAETNYEPNTTLKTSTFTAAEIVALAKSQGVSPTITSSGGTIATLFTDMGKDAESAIAENALENYNLGTESILGKVAAYALKEEFATAAGTQNLDKLAALIMNGTSADMNTTQFVYSDSGALVSAAIDVLDNKDGFIPLANETVMIALAKSGLLRKVPNQDPFSLLAGIRLGSKSISATGNLNDFLAPIKNASGVAWASAPLTDKTNAVKTIYKNFMDNSGIVFTNAEKARLLDELVKDFIGASDLNVEYFAQLESGEDGISNEVLEDFVKEYGSGKMRLASAPLKANVLVGKVNDVSLTNAQRKACLTAATVMFKDLSEIINSTTPNAAGTVVSNIARITPSLSATGAKDLLDTLIEFGGLSANDLQVFLQAFFDLDIIDDMDLQLLDLGVITPTTYSTAIGDIIVLESAQFAQYGTSANSISNVSEITSSWSNNLSAISSKLRGAFSHPKLDRKSVIAAVDGTFNAEMQFLDLSSGEERIVQDELASMLELEGLDSKIIENANFVKAKKVGRLITGVETYTYRS